MNNPGRNFILWALLIILALGVYNLFQEPAGPAPQAEIPYSEFIRDVEQRNVTEVIIKGAIIAGQLRDGRHFMTRGLESNPDMLQKLSDNNVRYKFKDPDKGSGLFSILLSWFPMLLLIGVWIFFLRQMQSGGNKAMGFGKSRARLLNENTTRVTFEDVAGVEEAKVELEEIIEFLRDPQKFQRLGGQIPKGVLLIGPPGTGKTLLARAIAGEANVPFFSISGSEFVEMFVGVGASRVRDLFEQGKKNAPCIIFIDEIDAVGRHRGAGVGGGNDEREQTLNQLLVEMDGFESNEGVILISATNRPDVLDPALTRPGRFDRQVVVPNPDLLGREQILKVHMRKVPLADDMDAKVIARGTPGFSGADLRNLVNEAALLAARFNKRVVSMAEFEEAKDKVMMGSERRSMVMTEEEKKLTAFHEAGHAIAAFHMEHSDPIHKATIIPRGRALGMVVRLPETDRVSMTRSKLHADLTVAMGGRVAEEMIFGHDQVTTGASNDIKHATDIARRMVTEWGLSDELGPLTYGENSQEVFLGHSVAQHQHISEATAMVIDKEVRRIVDVAYEHSKKILQENKDQLDLLGNALLEHETLTGKEIDKLFQGKLKKKKKKPVAPKPRKRTTTVPSSKPKASASKVTSLKDAKRSRSGSPDKEK